MEGYKVSNRELGYSFIISGEWKELKKESYEKYGLQGNILHFFMVVNDGKIVKAINVNREQDSVKSEVEYLKLVNLNIENLKEAKFEVSNIITLKTKDGRRIDKVIVGSQGAQMSLYFTLLKDIFMSFSTGVTEPNDAQDKELTQIVASLKAE